MKRLSYEEVKTEFQSYSYLLESLEHECASVNSKLKYQCPNHPDKELWVSLYSLRRGVRCKYCKQDLWLKTQIKEKLTILENLGYKYISGEYKNTHSRIVIQCNKNKDHIWTTTFKSLVIRNAGCPHCAGNARIPPDKAIKNIEEKGHKVISGEYKNTHSRFVVSCAINPEHIWEASYGKLIHKGTGCPHCTKNFRINHEQAMQRLKDLGYDVIGGIYKNAHSILELKCKIHPDHIWKTSFTALVSHNTGCQKCWFERNKGENNASWGGGNTELSHYLRGLLDEWKAEAFANQNRTCYISGATNYKLKMQVHHPENFYKIRDKILKDIGYVYKRGQQRRDFTEEEINIVSNKLLEKHKEFPGVVMTKNIHKLFHNIYGNRHNNMQQIEEFKQRYKAGEFNI